MKLPNLKIYLALAAMLAGGVGAFAQSNGVPGATEYTKFSQFVTDRNIFDPNRVPHYYPTGRVRPQRTRTRSNSAPALTLVGTMSYEKGLFAFFNGNSSDLKKALQVAEKIAGYTIVEISPNRVKLETSDKNHQFEMKVGDAMQQVSGKWVFAGAGELPGETGATGATESSGSGNSTPASPASVGEPNEILKRLMQLKEKENQ
jgi:hypothetical protein